MLLETIFKWVLYSSAMGGVLTILIIALKSIMGFRLSAKWHYYIWLLLIVRLILPFAPTSSVSISNLFAPFQNMYNTETSQYKDTDFLKRNDIENTPETPIGVNGAGQFKNEDIKSESNEILRGNQGTNKAVNGSLNLEIISYVWLSGMLMMLILVVLINVKLAFSIRRKSVCTDETLKSLINSCKDEMGIKSEIVLLSGDDFKTPMLFTLKKHKLLLPSSIINNMTDEEKRHIILHELAHLKRKDHLFSWVIVFLQIIHWFNPVIWFAFKKMRQDAESACDADVLSYVQPEKHKEYGNTIIKTVKLYSEPYFIPGVSTIGGCSGIKRRLSMIMNFNKYSAKWSILAVGIVIILAVSGLTNASISEGTAKKRYIRQDKKFRKDSFRFI